MQIAHVDGRWIAVTKEGDWWGDTVYLDRAPVADRPVDDGGDGPARNRSGRDHNTYFASLVPGAGGDVVVGLSNNRGTDSAPMPTIRPFAHFRSHGGVHRTEPQPNRSPASSGVAGRTISDRSCGCRVTVRAVGT